MIGVAESFSTSYAKARVKFLEAAATAGLPVESHHHPMPGRDGVVVRFNQQPGGGCGLQKLDARLGIAGGERLSNADHAVAPCVGALNHSSANCTQ